MTLVTAQMSVSLDGLLRRTAPHRPQTWLRARRLLAFSAPLVIDAKAWVSRWASRAGTQRRLGNYCRTFAARGAYVMGRRMADGGEIPVGRYGRFPGAGLRRHPPARPTT